MFARNFVLTALQPSEEAIERLKQVIWIPEYLDDIDADFLAIYHIDGFEDMESVRFFRLVHRLSAYEGAVSARIRVEQEEAKQKSPGPRNRGSNVEEVPVEAFSEFIEMRN